MPPGLGVEGAVRPVDDREGPVPVLPELLVAAVVRLAGRVTPTSMVLHLSMARCPASGSGHGGGCAS